MAEQLKYMFGDEFFEEFIPLLQNQLPDLNKEVFLNEILDKHWKKRELKERMWHISSVMTRYFPESFKKAVDIILNIVHAKLQNPSLVSSFTYMVLADYIEKQGLNEYNLSIRAFEEITKLISCEFAIRPFIIKYPDMMMKQMLLWSKNKHFLVRRLSSEGYRPRLPWAMALPELKKDPSPVFPILENLKNDEAETVRKSVANNLNDISKDNPDIVLDIAKKWIGKSKNTDWIIKHACRTLLKQGNPEALKLFGYSNTDNVNIRQFHLNDKTIRIGEKLLFSFSIVNDSNEKKDLRLEFGMYFLRANGKHNKKVFKISEITLDPKEGSEFNCKYDFAEITTRKYYPGENKIALIVNGIETETATFNLLT